RAHEGHLCPVLARYGGDFLVIRADDHPVETAAHHSGPDRPRDHRTPAEQANVLAGDALGAAPGRDYGKLHPSIASRSTSTTKSCSASVKFGCIGMLIASR